MTQNIDKIVSNESQTSLNDKDWEKHIAELVGFETQDYDKSDKTQFNHDFDNNHRTKLSLVKDGAETSQLRKREEETHQLKTKESLASNPFAKAALVGTSTLVTVIIAGVFLSQIMGNGNSTKVVKNNIETQNQNTSPSVPRLQQLETELETLKTKLALAKQADTIKAAQKQLRKTKSSQNSNSQLKVKTVTKPKTPKSITPTPTKTVYVNRLVRTAKPNSIQPNNIPPNNIPPNNTQPNNNIASKPVTLTPKPNPIPQQPKLLVPPPPTPPKEALSPTPNPLAEWQRLAKLGSYGQVSLNGNNTTRATTRASTPRISESISNQTGNNARTEVSKVPSQQPENKPKTSPKPNSSQFAQNSRNSQLVNVGSSAKAVIVTAIFGETTKGETEDENVFVVRLQEPLKSSGGKVVLEKGTELLTQVRSISASGMVQLSVTKVILNRDKQLLEKSLPENALTIKARKGRPLIAKNYPNNSSSIAWMDAGLFVLGGLGKASELFNRTESKVTTTTTGSIITNSNSEPNIGAGILEGGMKSVVPQIARRNQRAVSQMSRKTNLWFMKAGTKVEVYVNQAIQL